MLKRCNFKNLGGCLEKAHFEYARRLSKRNVRMYICIYIYRYVILKIMALNPTSIWLKVEEDGFHTGRWEEFFPTVALHEIPNGRASCWFDGQRNVGKTRCVKQPLHHYIFNLSKGGIYRNAVTRHTEDDEHWYRYREITSLCE